MPGLKEEESAITVEIQVQPRSSRDEICGFQNGRVKVKVTAPPEGGKANEKLREIIGKAFGVAKSKVEIVRGETSRLKTIKIHGVSRDEYDSFTKSLTT
ncbi:MAG: YggU family protein [Deltaproteobacteria bacterium]|nr:YggU family protein [Deltaproteobacteria bacterium]